MNYFIARCVWNLHFVIDRRCSVLSYTSVVVFIVQETCSVMQSSVLVQPVQTPVHQTPQTPQRRKKISMSKPLSSLLNEPQIDFPYSYFNEDKNEFTILNQAQSLQLLTVLRNHFPAVLSIIPVAPFLVIECNKAVPDPATTPFLIAGLIACFIVQGDPYPFGIDFIGEDGGALGFTEDQMPDFVWKDLKPFHIPRLATFEWI